MSKSTPPPKEV